jgi:hypothetical protein
LDLYSTYDLWLRNEFKRKSLEMSESYQKEMKVTENKVAQEKKMGARKRYLTDTGNNA